MNDQTDTPTPKMLVTAGVSSLAQYIAARSTETSTHIGAMGGAIAAPIITENATNAVLDIISGNYIGAVTHGIPALLGIAGSLAAIFTPENKGPTNDQITQAIAAMPREQLISLLTPPDANPVPNATAGV